jgi:hypothetical protein
MIAEAPLVERAAIGGSTGSGRHQNGEMPYVERLANYGSPASAFLTVCARQNPNALN